MASQAPDANVAVVVAVAARGVQDNPAEAGAEADAAPEKAEAELEGGEEEEDAESEGEFEPTPVEGEFEDETTDEVMDDDAPVQTAAEAEEDAGGELLRELIANWNVPSWDDVVTGLYRPER